jgi:predicted ArsR family transcriptional regulator
MAAEPTTRGSLEFLSATRQLLLVAIKNDGEATTEQLARETFLSAGAVRSHLLALEAQGLVSFLRVRDGPGRPRHVFRLTQNGESLFPQLYAQMANTLMAAIEAEDSAVVERVTERLLQAQLDLAAENLASTSRPERLLELVDMVDRYGFFPRLEVLDNGPAHFTLRHCPLLSVAGKHPQVCEVERRALRNVLPGATVERTAWRLEGDPVCRYSIAWDDA